MKIEGAIPAETTYVVSDLLRSVNSPHKGRRRTAKGGSASALAALSLQLNKTMGHINGLSS